MNRHHLGWASLVLGMTLGLPGCSADNSTAQVSGLITMDGQPIDKGAISFYPVDGKTTTSGGTIKNGLYSVQVPVGVMSVKISAAKVIGKKKLYDAPNSPERPLYAEALPSRYNEQTELRLEVTPGKMTKDWQLQSN